ncbi:MAG: NAD(P)-dependent oxidoreductase [Gemmatimonadota bacterium]|nr:NAD(P)-dependent oxidoreductase [Gemmatimonadota bacterium]
MSADAYAGRRVLVLGAAGFIGRWVARKLSEIGADLCLAVRDGAAAETVFSSYQVSGEIAVVDVERSRDVTELIARVKPCITFNLAGYGVDPAESDEQRSHRVNAELPEILARSAFPAGDASWKGHHVVHAGSALEYGLAEGRITERTVTLPTTAYGKSKLAGTLRLSRVRQELGTARGLTARLFTVYGPGEHRGRLLPSLLETADTGASLALTSGLQQRDFTYVEDAAEGMLRLGAAGRVSGDVVNLATGILTTVREFAEVAAKLLSIQPERLRFGALPTRGEEMQATAIDLSLLRDVTGWTPQTDIANGIRRTRDFVKGIPAS